MQDDANTTRPSNLNPEPRPVDPGNSDGQTESGGAAWAEIGRMIERQLRRDVARLVGAGETDEWGGIKDVLVDRVRSQAGSVDRTEVGRRVEQVGREIEEQIRTGLASAAGAGREADWAAIGTTLRERVERALDPIRSPFPGGSGTGASAEDASVPAAPPSPDRPPRPASAGGEDTGLPTVTDEVDELPRGPGAGSEPLRS